MSGQPRPPTDAPSAIQQAASLLDQGRQLLVEAAANAASEVRTAARVRQMPVDQLRRDPVLWAAYERGRRSVQDQAPHATNRPPGRRHSPARPTRANRRRNPAQQSRNAPGASGAPSTATPTVAATLTVAATQTVAATHPARPTGTMATPHPATTEWTGMAQPYGWWEAEQPTAGLGPLDRLPPPASTARPTTSTQPPPLPATANHRQRKNRQRMEAYLAAKRKTAATPEHQLGGKGVPSTPPPAPHPVPPPAPEPMDTGEPTPEEETTSGHVAPPETPNTAESAVPGTVASGTGEVSNDTFYTASPPTSPHESE